MEHESALLPLKESVSTLHWTSCMILEKFLVNLRLLILSLLSSAVYFRCTKEIPCGLIFPIGLSYHPSSFPCSGNSNNVWRTEQFTKHLTVEFLERYFFPSFLFSDHHKLCFLLHLKTAFHTHIYYREKLSCCC